MEEGCPTKAYKRTRRQCRKVLWVLVAYCVLIEAARCFSMIEENSTNTCTHASLSFLLKPREPESNNDKQSLSIGIVAYAKFCGTTFVETAVYDYMVATLLLHTSH